MKLYPVSLIAFVFLCQVVCQVFAPAQAEHLLRGGVAFSEKDVPFELFGQWDRTRHLVGSSVPKLFNTKDHGAWNISLNEGHIMLTNPKNGLSVPMNVSNVRGKETTFEYIKKLSNGRWCEETLTLEPAGDELQGFQEKVCFRPSGRAEQTEQYFFASAVVEGVRHREAAQADSDGFYTLD